MLPAKAAVTTEDAQHSRSRRDRRTDAARKPVLHVVMPGVEVARAEPKSRETISGFLRRTGWAKRDRQYGWQFKKGLPTVVEINGAPVLRRFWTTTRIAANDSVRFISYPLGGQGSSAKQVIGLVALVAVSAFALWAGPALFGAGIPGMLGTAAIGLGGALLINAMKETQMSAMNVIVQSNSVHLLTDALAFHPDGEIIMIGPKAVPMPHLNCAVAMRGPAGMRPIFAELIGNGASSFDGLREIIVELLQAGARNYAPLFESCSAGPDFEVMVAGISESIGPSAYLLTSHDRYGSAWTVLPVEGVTCLPNDQELHEKIGASLPSDGNMDAIDAATHGLRIMEMQRAHLIANDGVSGEFCAVGGFAQLTTITTEAVRSQILRRWPDKVGEKVAA